MRLQKYLSSAGICSRRKGEEHIKAGHVSVNGVVVTQLGSKVDIKKDRVEFQKRPVELVENLLYVLLNKPAGIVSSSSQKGEKTVLDVVNIKERLYPLGRLDKDSTGLLLLTNDGKIHHRLLHPSFDHEKEYYVTVEKPIPNGALLSMEKGLPMMGTKTRPAKITRISPKSFKIVLREGKNRQIRRMVRKIGNKVKRLKRIRIVNIKLGDLKEGSWRFLTKKEERDLLKIVHCLGH